jgi:hypothetical protein
MVDQIENGKVRMVIQSASETTVARMMEPSDYMYDIPLKVAGEMTGFNIVSKVRGH